MDTEVVHVSLVSNSRLLYDGLAVLLARYMQALMVASYTGYSHTDLPPDISKLSKSHVVLIDAAIGQEAAIRWIHHWRSVSPSLLVIVLDMYNDLEFIFACVEAGASGYSLQGSSITELIEAIKLAQQGGAICSPQVTATLFARLAAYRTTEVQEKTSPKIPLTQRELEVLQCIANDYSNQEIAEKLVIQAHTVKHHVHNILDKLKLRHRWDAARLAADQGWLQEEPLSQTRK